MDGTYSHDLLPMPYTFEAAKKTAQKIREARDFLEVPVVVENVSSYAEFHASEMTEWQFLTEVVEQADCGILLDVNNIYVSSRNHSFDPFEYLDNVPHERVAQIHIAGHSKYREVHPRHARPSGDRSGVATVCASHRVDWADGDTAGVGRPHSVVRRSARRGAEGQTLRA